MRKILILIFVLFISIQTISFADKDYEIFSYVVNADVSEDAKIDVEEIISINFKKDINRIYKIIPTHYNGYDHNVSNVEVLDAVTNKKIEFSSKKEGNNLKISINTKGSTNYKIKYKFDYGNDLIRSFDIFKYDFIGDNWDCSIPLSNITINMPKKFNEKDIEFKMTKFDIKTEDNIKYNVKGNTLSVNVNYLYPYQGLLIKMKLPKDYFKGATKINTQILLYLLIFIIALIVGVFWYKRIFDKKIKPIFSFLAPNGLNPVEIAYLYKKGKIDNNDFNSVILYWASKEYLNIIDQDGYFIYENRIDIQSIEDVSERKLYQEMFNYGDGSIVNQNQLENVFYTDVLEYKKELNQKYHKKYNMIDRSKYKMFFITFLINFLISILTSNSLTIQIGTNIYISFIIIFFMLMVSEIFLVFSCNIKSKIQMFAIQIFYFGMLIVFYSLMVENGYSNIVNMKNISFSFYSLKNIWTVSMILVYCFTLILDYIIINIEKYMLNYNKQIRKIHGFKEFLNNVTLKEIKSISYERPNYYYDMIAYLYIFDNYKKWQDYNTDFDMPVWYKSNHEEFELSTFIHRFNSSMNIIMQELDEDENVVGG